MSKKPFVNPTVVLKGKIVELMEKSRKEKLHWKGIARRRDKKLESRIKELELEVSFWENSFTTIQKKVKEIRDDRNNIFWR